LYKPNLFGNNHSQGGIMDFNESQTKVNLAKSFAAECQAGARYQFMATQAQMEGLVYVKDTMKMIAKNEMAHAKLFYDYIIEKSGECVVDLKAD
jgi:rubrerythrin